MTDVEQIKSKVDIVDFISEHIKLHKAGRSFKALCPFHSEKTPSFVVSPERQTWHCFGACGEGGDVISFCQKWENIEFVEALQSLAGRAGITLSNFVPTDTSRLKDKLYEINHLTSEFFYYLLTKHKLGGKAREYLNSRNIKDEIIKTFLLGYAPDSWDSLSRFLVKKGYSQNDIYTAGLIVRSDNGRYYDRFRGRLMFTLKDQRGNIVGFSGRKLPPQSEKEAKYVNTPETPVYIKGNILYGLDITKEFIKKENNAVVVEGEFDFLSSFQSGVTNVVAIKGSAFTEGQTILLKRYTEKVNLALDSDIAGNEAARRGIEIAENAGLVVHIVQVPFGKDPADCIEKDPHLWKKTVQNAIPIYDFIIGNAFEKYEKEGVYGKKKIGNEVIPFLSKIENPIIASHYVKLLADKLQVTEESIELSIRGFQKKKNTHEVYQPEKKVIPRDVLLEEHLLSLIIQSQGVADSLSQTLQILSTSDFHLPPVKKIIELLSAYIRTHKKFDVKEFGELMPLEVSPTFDKTYLKDIENILSHADKYNGELVSTANEIKKIALRRRVNILSTKLKESEDKTDLEKWDRMNEELKNLIAQIQEIDKLPVKT